MHSITSCSCGSTDAAAVPVQLLLAAPVYVLLVPLTGEPVFLLFLLVCRYECTVAAGLPVQPGLSLFRHSMRSFLNLGLPAEHDLKTAASHIYSLKKTLHESHFCMCHFHSSTTWSVSAETVTAVAAQAFSLQACQPQLTVISVGRPVLLWCCCAGALGVTLALMLK